LQTSSYSINKVFGLFQPRYGKELLSLGRLRPEIAQLRQYFTWAAVRYGLAYNRLAAVGLGLCVGLTVALLVAESRYILFGMTKAELQRIEALAHRIETEGRSHPLWRHIHRD
jgi:hypothetical protein